MLGSASHERKALLEPGGTVWNKWAHSLFQHTLVSFDECTEKLQSSDLQSVPCPFTEYVIRHIFPLMRKNVTPGNSRWPNNNCESMKHVHKQAIDWCPQQLPDLINTIRKLVDAHYVEANRAMCGVGDFVLRGLTKRQQVNRADGPDDGSVQPTRHSAGLSKRRRAGPRVSSDA